MRTKQQINLNSKMSLTLVKIITTISILCPIVSVAQDNTTQQIYLSGKGYDDAVEWQFFCSEGQNSGEWKTIPVPYNWETAGFGEYTYGRWYKKKGERPSDENGHYKRTFDVPSSWEGKNIRIVFEGVMTDTKVLVNDQQAGEIHQGGFYRFSYDITPLVKYGAENVLDVFVEKQSADHSVNRAERYADWWLFGGIYRPVYLEVKPAEHIEIAKLYPQADGKLNADIYYTKLTGNRTIKLSLKGQDGTTFADKEFNADKNSTKTSLSTQWDNIKAWNPEEPNLYYLTISLEKKGKASHTIKERIGFRTIEVRAHDGVYCNGKKIVLKGVNRHSFWPKSGRCTSPVISLKDVQLIKDMNMNAVRSHYPPDTHFLDLCDSLGLFIMDELAGWQNCYRTSIGSKLVKEMIYRDMNHPSVILWSNGNEGGWNTDIDPMFDELDIQKRDVIHPWADFDDIDAHHYPQYSTGLHRFYNGEKIFMPTEFLHSLYDEGAGAGLEDFWNQWSQSPLFAGGFIWAFNDGGVVRTDLNDSIDSDSFRAPDGIVGPYRQKEGSFYTIKEIWSPIQIEMPLLTKYFNGEFYVSNQYIYSNLDKCSLSYKIKTIPLANSQNNDQTIAEGDITLPSIEPGEKKRLKMTLPKNFLDGDLLCISAKDAYGRELFTWSYPLRSTKDYLTRKGYYNDKSKAKASYKISGNEVSLSANDIKAVFDGSTGMIKNISTKEGDFPLKNGPIPVGMKAIADNYKVRQEEDTAVMTVWYKGAIDSIRWEMHPDGKLKMAMLSLNKSTNDGGFDGGFVASQIELWGLTFDFDEKEATDITWFGKGPYRVWKNRQKGATLGLWQKEYNNTITGESFSNLQYPEFKGYHADMYWAKIGTKSNIPLSIATENSGVFLRLFTPEQPHNRQKGSNPHFPKGDISFLYEITPIHAFKPTSQMGPHSAPTSIRIKPGDDGISMIIWFDLAAKK